MALSWDSAGCAKEKCSISTLIYSGTERSVFNVMVNYNYYDATYLYVLNKSDPFIRNGVNLI